MTELLRDLVPESRASLTDSGGTLLLLIVGIVAISFVGYLVYDYFKVLRRQRRMESMSRGHRD